MDIDILDMCVEVQEHRTYYAWHMLDFDGMAETKTS
jgi:hypothetical protein